MRVRSRTAAQRDGVIVIILTWLAAWRQRPGTISRQMARLFRHGSGAMAAEAPAPISLRGARLRGVSPKGPQMMGAARPRPEAAVPLRLPSGRTASTLAPGARVISRKIVGH